ncbi:MAG: adenylate kinase [Candidatus Komeilibacteria bacterium]
MHKIVMLGPPGSGKGTQAKLLAQELNIPAISTGKIFRSAIRSGSDLGKQVKERMDAGILIDDELTNEIVKERLNEADVANGYILDGYPRTMPQVEYLESLADITLVLNIDSSDEVITERMAARRMCKECGANFNILFKPPKVENVCDKCNGELYTRSDAKPEAIKERIATYHGLINPILEHYKNKGILININGEPSIEEVWVEVKNKLEL